MYNLKKHDLVLFNPKRSPFGAEELCLGIVTTDPDYTDLNGEHGAAFYFESAKDYFKNDSILIDSGYSGRTGNVIYNFGRVTKEQFLNVTRKSTLNFL